MLLKLFLQVDLHLLTQVDHPVPLVTTQQELHLPLLVIQVDLQVQLLAIKLDHQALHLAIKLLLAFLPHLVKTQIQDILPLQEETKVTKEQVLGVQVIQRLEVLLRNPGILDILSNLLPPTSHLPLKEVMQVMEQIPTVGADLLKVSLTQGHLNKNCSFQILVAYCVM